MSLELLLRGLCVQMRVAYSIQSSEIEDSEGNDEATFQKCLTFATAERCVCACCTLVFHLIIARRGVGSDSEERERGAVWCIAGVCPMQEVFCRSTIGAPV